MNTSQSKEVKQCLKEALNTVRGIYDLYDSFGKKWDRDLEEVARENTVIAEVETVEKLLIRLENMLEKHS